MSHMRRVQRLPHPAHHTSPTLAASPFAAHIAEHVMLVDLGRNDVGRVAEYGSVQVHKLMEVERYSHVMHISSTVTGSLRAGLDCWDAMRAALPAGTVSGAPKVSTLLLHTQEAVVERKSATLGSN